MKYIRLKDGRIILFLDEDKETELPNRDLRFYYIQSNHVIAFIGKNEIIKQADTIEELCDEYILKRSDESKPRVLNKDNIDYYKNFNKEGGPEHSYSIELFCAIWVRDIHGGILLKPVAKLNDKGDSEVLL